MPFSDTIFKSEQSAQLCHLKTELIRYSDPLRIHFEFQLNDKVCYFFRGLVRKYSQVIQRYYVQYLSGYDAIALDQAIQVNFN